jgi:FimV-like protein
MTHHLLRTILLIAAWTASTAQAVTLGQVTVNSFLGEPLDAEISLIGLAPDQHQDLRLRIANQKHFDRLGIAYERYLADFAFDVVQSGNQWLVRARSTRPITEPFVDFPLQMNWPGGQLIKQYTLLLDPRTLVRPARVARTRPAPPPAAAAPLPPRQIAPAAAYGPVQRGETLWPIAQKLKPRGITTRQMAMALLRANPQAFIDGNVNKLRAGATLSIPPRDFIEQMDAATARAEFAAQTRRWQAPVATSPRVLEGAAAKPTAAAPAPTSAQPTPPQVPPAQQQDSEPQLRILTDKAEDEPAISATEQELQEQLLVTMEEIESNRINTNAIAARLADLEAEIDRMQKLVDLKNAQISALQSEVSARAALGQQSQPAASAALAPDTESAAIGPKPAATPAPGAVARIEPVAVATAPPSVRPWYEEYLWVAWALLGLLGLNALLLLMRRPQAVPAEARTAELPTVNRGASAAVGAAGAPAAADLLQAEEDLRVAAAQAAPADQQPLVEEELPELDIAPAHGLDDDIDDRTATTLLDAMLDGDKRLAERPQPSSTDTEFSDDDIASWVAELGAEIDRADGDRGDARSANDEQLPLDDDIPSILTELDDQLASGDAGSTPQPAAIDLEPVESVGSAAEDDTFSMSLDLARAYLEIGDQEGAKDMLKQALAGARDPEHRHQIEELLQQID